MLILINMRHDDEFYLNFVRIFLLSLYIYIVNGLHALNPIGSKITLKRQVLQKRTSY